jgi:protein-S-isoprenylcysteine O-methyltransferase Ste14
MNKLLSAVYAAVCYAIFLVAFLYAIGFVGNFIVPRSIDASPTALDAGMAALLNAALLGAFAVQHSVMARHGFKVWWTKLVPRHIERSTYVLISSLILLGIFWFWAPMTAVVWSVSAPLLRAVIWGVFGFGWLVVLTSTFMIDHFDLFGLRQVYLYLNGKGPRPPEFRTRFFYGLVRHPIMSGFIVAFWATPTMTMGHLLFAVATTGYILIGTRLEERDLVAAIGQPYVDYQKKVPALIPLPRGKD